MPRVRRCHLEWGGVVCRIGRTPWHCAHSLLRPCGRWWLAANSNFLLLGGPLCPPRLKRTEISWWVFVVAHIYLHLFCSTGRTADCCLLMCLRGRLQESCWFHRLKAGWNYCGMLEPLCTPKVIKKREKESNRSTDLSASSTHIWHQLKARSNRTAPYCKRWQVSTPAAYLSTPYELVALSASAVHIKMPQAPSSEVDGSWIICFIKRWVNCDLQTWSVEIILRLRLKWLKTMMDVRRRTGFWFP